MWVNCHPSSRLTLRIRQISYIMKICAGELSLHTTHIKMEGNTAGIQGKEGRQENKRQRPGSSDEDCPTFLCQKCDQNIHDKVYALVASYTLVYNVQKYQQSYFSVLETMTCKIFTGHVQLVHLCSCRWRIFQEH